MFKAGQKVRIVGCSWPENEYLIGTETVIVRNIGGDRYECTTNGTGCWWAGKYLQPLTPPHEACDDAEFIASLDRLAAKVEEIA